MKRNTYWQNRAAQRMYEYQKQADDVADDVAKAYIKATEYINSEISKIFRTFQIDCGISEDEARELLNNMPDDVSLNNIKAVIETIDDPQTKQDMLNVINSPAYAYRIRRLESLQNDIDTQIRDIAELEENVTKVHYKELADYAYNRAVFDIQQGTGIGFAFDKMPKSRVREILKQNWSGKLLSERIWGNTNEINTVLKRELLTGFMTGRSYAKTAISIQEQMEIGAYEARRLVRTESTYIANSAEMESYKNSGIDKYRFIATLDIKTSEICASLDNKTFDVEDATPGTNMPPMHPWCRSTTIAELGDEMMKTLTRAARDPVTGEQYKIPADMTYEEWKKYVDKKHGDGTFAKMRKMYVNEKKDREQYNKYIGILGKDNMPETFDKFQLLKYNNINEWDDLKYYARNINGRPIEYVKIDRELEKLGITKKGKAYPLENIEMSAWNEHAEDRLVEWNMSKDDALKYKADAIAIMRRFPEPNTQWNYYSDEGIIGVRHSDGVVCTVICKDRFGNDTEEILKVMKKWLK